MNPKRVACIDDDADVLKVRKILLEASGYSVVTTTSAQELLGWLAGTGDIDVVLLDYLMPGMNGDELAQKLRQQYPHLPLVAISAVPQLPESMLRFVDATVQKGSDPKVLIATVASVLARPPGEKIAAMQPAQLTVLCVDDEDLQLTMRKRLFESAGYRVLGARSANDAFDLFRSNHVDAVVMDYWLSGRGENGTGLAQQMKRLRRQTPIVMLSGLGALPGEGAIVDLWLSKSRIEPQALVAEVHRLIELHTPQLKEDSPER